MGNDGGSIPDRRDLVKSKPKAEQADKANQTRARWFYCALSKRPLQEPIVSCALGKLYNKDAIIEFLLDRSTYGDGEEICGHIKSLKDVKTLKLTPNPAPSSQNVSESNGSTDKAQFVCPLTLKDMNGSHPFVYIATCGCVMSREGLRAVSGSSNGSSGSTPPAEGGETSAELDLCPQCSKKYNKKEDVILLNPDPETEAVMRAAMEVRRAKAKAGGKAKKRKAEGEAGAGGGGGGTKAEKGAPKGDAEGGKTKKARTSPAPTINPNVAATSRAVVSSLAAEEAKRKANMSDAVKSLYESKNKGQKETFMTRGTFTRYA